MALSLIEELPKIVKEGKAEAARILERIQVDLDEIIDY